MANKSSIRDSLVAGFWLASLFLYISAAAPLVSLAPEVSKVLGMVSVALVGFGCLIFRTRFVLEAVTSAKRVVGDRARGWLHFFSWLSFLMMMAIFVGYASVGESGIQSGSKNFLLTPFGFLFFYVGRWCILKVSPAKRGRESVN